MMMNTEEPLLKEIRRQALIHAGQRRREEQNRRDLRYTLDALQEVTNLPRRELEAIAADVRAFYEPEDKGFFSVKSQFMMVSSGLALMGLCLWITIRFIY